MDIHELEQFEDWFATRYPNIQKTIDLHNDHESIVFRNNQAEAWQAAKDESHKSVSLYQSEINHLAAANQKWRDYAVKAQAIPDGFVLVPREPTSEMLVAADNCAINGKVTANIIYKAMIEASQEPK